MKRKEPESFDPLAAAAALERTTIANSGANAQK
jgi:hypothetical protein